MLSTAWAEDITASLTGIPRRIEDDNYQNVEELFWDLFIFVNGCIWIANFAIQPVQMGLRALIVDLVPTEQQTQANAWAARFVMVGNVIGYCINMIDLTKHFNYLGRSQFQILCVLVSINLAVCVSITCYWVQEKKPRKLGFQEQSFSVANGVVVTLKRLKQLSVVARKSCIAQSFSWLAWFPFLFYTAQYVAGLQERSVHFSSADSSLLQGEMTRTGSSAMSIFAVSSLVMSIALPWIVKPTVEDEFQSEKQQYSHSYIQSLCSLRRIWLTCHIVFFICMASTFVTDNVGFAYFIVAVTGVSWAGTTWIPFTLISKDIRRPQDDRLQIMEGGDKDLAATIVGIHNIAIAAPQIIAALGSSIFFLVVRHGEFGGQEVWLLRAGGCSALVAAWVIRTLPEESDGSV